MKRSIAELMLIAENQRDVKWLKDSLQNAIKLEHATIPVYLTGYWSIKDLQGEAATLIRSIAMEEMYHMALVCNILASIGGEPKINTIRLNLPGKLPGGVHPNLTVYMGRLTKEIIKEVYMEIEKPDGKPFGEPEKKEHHKTIGLNTIGQFYDAIIAVFRLLAPKLTFSEEKQVITQRNFGHQNRLTLIKNVDDAIESMNIIKEQGEGTEQGENTEGTPLDEDDDLSHYYKFGEIFYGKRLIYDKSTGKWTYSGAEVKFPNTYSIVPEIPKGGYPDKTKVFDSYYSWMMDELQAAWDYGSESALRASMQWMLPLTDVARELMQTPIIETQYNYSPSWIYIANEEDRIKLSN